MHAGPVASYSAVARGTSGGVASALAGTFDRGGPQVLAAVDGAPMLCTALARGFAAL